MELISFPSLPLLATFFLLLLMLIKKGNKYSTTNNPDEKPPTGPWKLPIIGSMHHMLGALPHHALRDLAKKHGPVMHMRLGQVDHIVISSSEGAKEVMKTHDINFASRPEILAAKIVCYGCTDIAFAPYGNYWRQLRKICVLELLSVRRVKLFCSLREEEISNLVRSISHKGKSPINLTERFLLLANTITSRSAFGTRCKHQERFLAAATVGVKLASGFCVADLFPSLSFIDVVTGMKYKLDSVHRRIDKILDEIIEERKEEKTKNKSGQDKVEEEDLLDVLLRLQHHGDLEFPLSINNIKAVIVDMFVAGTETSSTLLDWAMSELIKNPRVMEKAQAEVRQLVLKGKAKIDEGDIGELHYLNLVIKETLRLHPPVPLLLPRLCKETCNVSGHKIAAGSKVIINAWALGRDPNYWDDAESFNPERFDGNSIDFKGASFEFVPFGAGRRICPGMAFGLATVELTLAQLLFYFNWELPSGMKPEELDMTESFGATMSRKNNLCLAAIPHIPLPSI